MGLVKASDKESGLCTLAVLFEGSAIMLVTYFS